MSQSEPGKRVSTLAIEQERIFHGSTRDGLGSDKPPPGCDGKTTLERAENNAIKATRCRSSIRKAKREERKIKKALKAKNKKQDTKRGKKPQKLEKERAPTGDAKKGSDARAESGRSKRVARLPATTGNFEGGGGDVRQQDRNFASGPPSPARTSGGLVPMPAPSRRTAPVDQPSGNLPTTVHDDSSQPRALPQTRQTGVFTLANMPVVQNGRYAGYAGYAAKANQIDPSETKAIVFCADKPTSARGDGATAKSVIPAAGKKDDDERHAMAFQLYEMIQTLQSPVHHLRAAAVTYGRGNDEETNVDKIQRLVSIYIDKMLRLAWEYIERYAAEDVDGPDVVAMRLLLDYLIHGKWTSAVHVYALQAYIAIKSMFGGDH